jgi:hypothetical protein
MKGYQGITDMLNLPSLEDVLKDHSVDVDTAKSPDIDEPQIANTIEKLNTLTARMAMVEGTDHSDSMDELYKEILGHARELMAYGFNIDQPRARGIFEVAASMYGHAMAAANTKREAQIKTMKLSLERKRVDLEERRTNHAIGQQAATVDSSNNTIIVEDRNELIKRLREQIQK